MGLFEQQLASRNERGDARRLGGVEVEELLVQGLVDAYLAKSGTLRGVLIHAESGFPGWQDFAALVAHLKFVTEHHRRIEKVAVLADGGVAAILPSIANHFVHAQVKHFDLANEGAARHWLAEDGDGQMRTAA